MPTPLINATPVAVTYRDGKTETVTLSELSIRNLYQFIKHLGGNDTPALVALCAGKPIEWVDTLTDESFDALVAASIKLNFQRATDRVKIDPVALSRIGPMLLEIERVSAGILAMPPDAMKTPGHSGSGSSPEGAPSASAAATGIASSS